MDDLNCHAARAQKAVRDTFCNESVGIAKRFWNFFQQEILTIFIFADKAACDVAMSFQGDIAHCQWTVRERIEYVGQGDCQGDPSRISQGGVSTKSGDPDSRVVRNGSGPFMVL